MRKGKFPIRRQNDLSNDSQIRAGGADDCGGLGSRCPEQARSIGRLKIVVKANGFERYIQKGIVLQVGDNVALDVSMKVGTVSQSVEVNASASMVQTQDTSISEVIDRQRINDLPLNGRLPTQLVVAAGAATNYIPNGGDLTGSKNYSSSVSISVQGGEGNGVDYLLDGADHNDPFSNVNLPLPIPDALEEFSVQMNGLSARYGVHPGATANFVTKSGTNSFHGDLFEFVRNGDFNARLFGAAAEDTLRRNQFGGTAGGAIKKGKLFYFGAYQGTRLRTAPGTTNSFIPNGASSTSKIRWLPSTALPETRGASIPPSPSSLRAPTPPTMLCCST